MDHALPTPITLTNPKAKRRPVTRMMRLFLNIWSERRRLADLDDRMLKDIGVSREEVLREAGRLPWDYPHNRQK